MLTELSSVSWAALALSGHTVAVVVTVGDFTLVVTDAALGALPARVAATAALLVVSVVAAEHRAGALGAVWPRVAGAALTASQDTGAVTRAATWTATTELPAEAGRQLQTLRAGGVIVEREEPVASLQVVAHLPPHAGLAGPRVSPAGPEAGQDVADVVDGEARHGVLTSVETWRYKINDLLGYSAGVPGLFYTNPSLTYRGSSGN